MNRNRSRGDKFAVLYVHSPRFTEAERVRFGGSDAISPSVTPEEVELVLRAYYESYVEDEGGTLSYGEWLNTQQGREAKIDAESEGASVTVRSNSELNLFRRTVSQLKSENRFLRDRVDFRNEGDSHLSLTENIVEVNYSFSIEPPYGSAVVVLEMSRDDAHLYLAGTVSPANYPEGLGSSATYRNLVTGSYITVGDFMGVVDSVSVSESLDDMTGNLNAQVTISATHVFNRYTLNELRQTLRRKGDLTMEEIEPSAVTQFFDFKNSFVDTIRQHFGLTEATQPSVILEKVIRGLGGAKVPKTLNKARSLGSLFRVLDGSAEAMAAKGFYGDDADVIKGKMVGMHAGMTASNMTHHEIIKQMFMPSPELMELFPIARRVEGQPLEQYIVYRYKPANPYHPPTGDSLRSWAASVNDVDNQAQQGQTNCEQFFEGFRERRYPSNRDGGRPTEGAEVATIPDHLTLIDMTYTHSETSNINFTYCESLFSKPQASDHNFFRKGVMPALNVHEINRHGLRSASMSVPLSSTSTDPEEIKRFNKLAPSAFAERLFHTVGLGRSFADGTLTFSRHGNTFEVVDVLIGHWYRVNRVGHLRPMPFTFYVEDVSVSMSVSPNGVVTSEVTVSFTRGFYGTQAVPFDLKKVTPESNDEPVVEEEE